MGNYAAVNMVYPEAIEAARQDAAARQGSCPQRWCRRLLMGVSGHRDDLG